MHDHVHKNKPEIHISLKVFQLQILSEKIYNERCEILSHVGDVTNFFQQISGQQKNLYISSVLYCNTVHFIFVGRERSASSGYIFYWFLWFFFNQFPTDSKIFIIDLDMINNQLIESSNLLFFSRLKKNFDSRCWKFCK